MKNILCIGHCTIDIFFEITEANVLQSKGDERELCVPFPEKIYVPKRGIGLGGNAVNVGASLLINNYNVALVSRTGEDALGSIIYRNLVELGFDLQYTCKEGESDSSVILFHDHDRSILSYHGKTPYRFPLNLPDIEWIYLSSLGFEDYQTFHEKVLEYISTKTNRKLIYNPGENEIRHGFATVKKIMEKAHTVILNKEEARTLVSKVTEYVGQDLEIENLLKMYIQLGVQNIIITDGSRGAYYANALQGYYYMPILKVDVVDATGAGDSFSSGYLIGLIEGLNQVQALKYGMAQSASCIQHVGATHGLRNFTQLTDLLKLHPEVVAEERFYE